MVQIYKLETEVDAGNPVGEVHWVDVVETKVNELYQKWLEEYPQMDWYQKWINWSRPNLYRVTMFLLDSLDELILIVDDAIESGPDKKATVIAAIDKLYEFVAKEAIPIFLRPFAGTIKNYIVYTLIAGAIDWIVNKYRNGVWRDKLEDIKEDIQEELDEKGEGTEEA